MQDYSERATCRRCVPAQVQTVGLITNAPRAADFLRKRRGGRRFGPHPWIKTRKALQIVESRSGESFVDSGRKMNEHSFMTVVASRRTRTATPRSERLEKPDKRDAILRAAIDTFAARGYFTAQVADVARAAGIAAGTVYLYFRGKDDLLVSIFERTMKDAIAEGRASVAAIEDPVERLREIARLHLGRLGRDRNLAIVFQVELRQSTKFMERFSTTHVREYLGIIRDVIAEGQSKGAFRAQTNPTLAAKLFFGALDEMATNWILSRRRYALANEADAIVELFVGGLGRG
jgi:TetR/AcrR family transcriptional regulator, fatty acid metabolism regulator protein